ncbi:uncharacterized protein LOC135351399 [Halichondria panicea]|uniref:uncharacterized protein LOC135351399 n=1 Tax=Halichondria panicea TaxID=6063 RepID=UPI00312B69C3
MFNRHPRKAVTFDMDQRDGADAIEDRGDADQLSGEETENEEDGEDMDGILRRLMEIRDRCHLNAKENIAAAQQKQKQQYDNKHNSLKSYPVGSSVMLKNMANSHRMGGKMDCTWKGPYIVHKILDKGRYELQSGSGKVLKKCYNGVLLKEYYSPETNDEENTLPGSEDNHSSPVKSPPKNKRMPDVPSQKPDIPSQKPDVPSQKPDIPSQKPDVPFQKPDLPSQKPDVPSQKPDVPSQKPDLPSQKPDLPSQKQDKRDKRPLDTKDPCKSPPRKKQKSQGTMWLKTLDLNLFDKQVLSAIGGMLSDKHMRAAHQLLSMQFLKFEGCYNTLLAQLKAFPPVSNNQGPAVQIFFVEERQHWIATSLFKGELYLYDSCFNGTLSPSTELQIAQVYSPLIQCNGLLISVVALQQQEGANNCGLFSIAAAYHAAMNDNVDSLVFDEAKMRAHLIKCFEKGKLSRFPRTKKAMPKRPTPQTIAITIYCMCKRPDSFEDMVMCDKCSEWYHYRCAKIRKEPVGNWFCSGCITL